MTALALTRRSKKALTLLVRLRPRPTRHTPEAASGQGPGTPDVWLAGPRLGG